MCLQDYRIGARSYPRTFGLSLDGNGEAAIPPNPNRIALIASVLQGDISIYIPVGSQYAIVATGFNAADQPAIAKLYLKHEGAVVFGPLRVFAQGVSTVTCTEIIGEPGLVEDIVKGAW